MPVVYDAPGVGYDAAGVNYDGVVIVQRYAPAVIELGLTAKPLDPLSTVVWTDITPYVQRFNTKRGRQHELQRVEPGTATLLLNDRDRRFDPTNTASPYYPNLQPMRRLRIRALYDGVTYPIFCGYVEDFPLDWQDVATSNVELTAFDAFALFALTTIDKATLLFSTTGTRAHHLLDQVGFPAADRVITAASSTTGAESLANVGALPELQAVADTEATLQFMDGSGQFRFDDRHASYLASHAPLGRLGESDLPAYLVVVQQDGPKGYWKLDETSGTVAGDSSGNAITGTYTNGPTLGQPAAIADGGKSVLFDGINDYVVLPTNALLNITGDITLESWFKSSSSTSGIIIGGYLASGSFPGYGLILNFPTIGVLGFYNGAGWNATVTTWNNGAWHHVAAVLSGTTLSFYVDGRLDRVITGVAAPNSYSGARAIGAAAGGSVFFPGNLDEPAIYNRALSIDEVREHYRAGILGQGLPYILPESKPQLDSLDIWNEVQASGTSGNVQTAVDSASRLSYGRRVLNKTGLKYGFDPEAFALGEYLISQYKDPAVRVRTVKMTPLSNPALMYPQTLGRELGDYMTFSRSIFGGGGPAFEQSSIIEGIEHNVDGPVWETRWALTPSKVPPNPFILDSSLLDGPAQLVF